MALLLIEFVESFAITVLDVQSSTASFRPLTALHFLEYVMAMNYTFILKE